MKQQKVLQKTESEPCHAKNTEEPSPICHGWLVVCEGQPERMMHQEVKLPWHAGYCVFDPSRNTICCYNQEPPKFSNRSLLNRRNTVRMDGGGMTFSNHWRIGGRPPLKPPIAGSHTIARSCLQPVKERPPVQNRFLSISRMPRNVTSRPFPTDYFG